MIKPSRVYIQPIFQRVEDELCDMEMIAYCNNESERKDKNKEVSASENKTLAKHKATNL